MKRSNLKLVFSFLLLVVMVVAIFSCNKTNLPPDPNANLVVKREIVVSALDIFTKDSISQFSVTVVSPTATSTQVTTGKTYVIKDPVAGNYKFTITKTGYADPAVLTFSLVLPTDPKASMSLPASVLMTKTAAPVQVTGATGAVIAVKTNSLDAGSTPVAAATVAPGTVFTLADGSKPATVAISVSNVPLAVDNAPKEVIGGVNTTVLEKPVEVINGQVTTQKLDLQPSGLVLSQPMTIDMYIGNDYPPTMSLAEKTARQAGLTLNYVRKDGTVEVVTPDRFSTDRNTVYYKISHFSQWGQTNKYVTITEAKALIIVPINEASKSCGAGMQLHIQVDYPQPPKVGMLMGAGNNAISFRTRLVNDNIPGKPGYLANINVRFSANTLTVSDATPGYPFSATLTVPTQDVGKTVNYVVCHQQ